MDYVYRIGVDPACTWRLRQASAWNVWIRIPLDSWMYLTTSYYGCSRFSILGPDCRVKGHVDWRLTPRTMSSAAMWLNLLTKEAIYSCSKGRHCLCFSPHIYLQDKIPCTFQWHLVNHWFLCRSRVMQCQWPNCNVPICACIFDGFKGSSSA